MNESKRNKLRDKLKPALSFLLRDLGLSTQDKFRCLNPEHNDETPSMSYYKPGNTCHCFGCSKNMDVFDITMLKYGLSYIEAVDYVNKHYGHLIESENDDKLSSDTDSTVTPKKRRAVDYSEDFKRWSDNLPQTEYLAKRGISDKTANRHQVGYDPDYINKINSENGKGFVKGALMIPTSSESYTIRPTSNDKGIECRYRKMNGTHVFNLAVLGKSKKPIFVTEGEIDAMSYEEIGLDAIALCGVNFKPLIDYLKENRINCKLILSLDNDECGQAETKKLAAILDEIDVKYQIAHFWDNEHPYKDPNEALVSDRDYFRSMMYKYLDTTSDYDCRNNYESDENANDIQYNISQDTMEEFDDILSDYSIQVSSQQGETIDDEFSSSFDDLTESDETNNTQDSSQQSNTQQSDTIDDYDFWFDDTSENDDEKASDKAQQDLYQSSEASHIDEFCDTVKSAKLRSISTGFKTLDVISGGGLRSGTYVLGAMSSSGKTTFVQQVAANIAENGDRVLYFGLEMSKNELTAKNISRIVQQKRIDKGIKGKTITAGDILFDGRYKKYGSEAEKGIFEAIDYYKERIAPNLSIISSSADENRITVKGIHDEIKKQMNCLRIVYGEDKRMVVVIDYLQLLAPDSEKATDKMIVDYNMSYLQRIAASMDIPIIIISSVNRDAYGKSIEMASYKESGNIEYGADQLWGLNYSQVGKDNNAIKAAKKKYPREVEIEIIKQRLGPVGEVIKFKYYPDCDLFIEVAGKS